MKNRIREYRAWDGEKFIYDFSITTEGQCLYSGEIYPWPITEFFGLHDQDGKKLFEGDINEHGHVLKFNVLHNCFGWFSINGFRKEILSDYHDKRGNYTYLHDQVKKSGNIFENQNLMKP